MTQESINELSGLVDQYGLVDVLEALEQHCRVQQTEGRIHYDYWDLAAKSIAVAIDHIDQ